MGKNHCHIHTDKVAKIRCYYCKTYICNDCIVHKDRHYFCSDLCVWKNRWKELLVRLKKRRMMALVVWNLLLSVILMGSVAILLNRQSGADVPDSEAIQPFVETHQTFVLPAPLDSLQKLHREPAEQSASSYYTVTLDLKNGWVVNGWRNDWPVFSEIIRKNGRQTFTLPLSYGENDLKLAIIDQHQKTVGVRHYSVRFRNEYVALLNRSIVRGNPSRRYVSLTFDGGSMATGADSILDILARRNVQTTMFLTGQFVERYPELVKRMLADGHEIGNHTYNHPHLTLYDSLRQHVTRPEVNREFIFWQLKHTDSLFFQLTGQHMVPFWRAPYGEVNPEIIQWAAEAGYMHVHWGRALDTRDWMADENQPGYLPADKVLRNILEMAEEDAKLNGGIILMHLGTQRETAPMYTVLDSLINGLRARGYNLVSVKKNINP
jgi:peptidoglycan/xylan/chitin deacetylase (PgdA/CDA1 family)